MLDSEDLATGASHRSRASTPVAFQVLAVLG